MRRPSGVQIGDASAAGSNVRRDSVSRTRSTNQKMRDFYRDPAAWSCRKLQRFVTTRSISRHFAMASPVRADDVESGWRPVHEVPEMPSVEERLASLEARMDRMDDLHNLIAGLRGDMTRQFSDVRADMTRQFTDVRADMTRQFDLMRSDMDRRFDVVNGQLGELRSDTNRLIQALDVKVDRHFTWVVGIQAALMLAVIGAMVGAYYR